MVKRHFWDEKHERYIAITTGSIAQAIILFTTTQSAVTILQKEGKLPVDIDKFEATAEFLQNQSELLYAVMRYSTKGRYVPKCYTSEYVPHPEPEGELYVLKRPAHPTKWEKLKNWK